MAFQSVPETAEVALIFNQNGEPMQNTFHGRLPGGYGTTELEALATAVDAAVGLHFLPILPTSCSYIKTEVRGLEFENDQVVENVDSSGPGAVAVVEAPNNVSFAVKKLSGLTGRSARGRVFWVAFPQTAFESDTNFLTNAHRLAVVGAVDNVRVAIVGAGWNPVIVSRFAGGAKRPTGVTFPWTVVSTTDDRVDTMRRRLPNT